MLILIEPADDDLTLEELLIFFSGAKRIPPLGFDPMPTLAFNEGVFPTASTCSLTLSLPLSHDDYASFKDKITYGVHNSNFFGLV